MQKKLVLGRELNLLYFYQYFRKKVIYLKQDKRNKLSPLSPYLIVYTEVYLAQIKVNCNRKKDISEKI